jgi:hypothetical protein
LPALLLELSRLLSLSETELVKEVVPHVIGWLCVHQKKDELQVAWDTERGCRRKDALVGCLACSRQNIDQG